MNSLFATLVVGLVLAISGSALAQTSPTQNAYGGDQAVAGETTGGGTSGDLIPPPSTGDAPDSGLKDDQAGSAPTTSVRTETGAGAPTPASTGSLPFTGFEAGLVAMAGLLLLGTGLAIRRASQSRA